MELKANSGIEGKKEEILEKGKLWKRRALIEN